MKDLWESLEDLDFFKDSEWDERGHDADSRHQNLDYHITSDEALLDELDP